MIDYPLSVKPRIYVETSVVSYLAARASRDALTNFRQTLTHLWWERAQNDCELFISGLVLTEIGRGDPAAAARRQAFCERLAVLPGDLGSMALAQRLLDSGLVPASELEDALHIAEATLSGMDYLATWNFAHFVNLAAKYKLVQALVQWGYAAPLFVTPEELFESLSGASHEPPAHPET